MFPLSCFLKRTLNFICASQEVYVNKMFQKPPPEVFYKKVILKISKSEPESLFNKIVGLRPAT